MKLEVPILEAGMALAALARSGYYHQPIQTPKAAVEAFCEEHGLRFEAHFFNYTITPAEVVPETAAEVEDKWEKIRLENLAKRQRNAAARKKRETQNK